MIRGYGSNKSKGFKMRKLGILAAIIAATIGLGAVGCANDDGNVYSKTTVKSSGNVVIKVHVGTAPDRYKEFTHPASKATGCNVGSPYPKCLTK
jgi:hypothetical protein